MRKVLSLLLLAGSTTMALMIFVQKTPGKIVAINSQDDLLVAAEKFSSENVPNLPSSEPGPEIQKIGSAIAEEIIAQNPEGPEMLDEQFRITATNPDEIAEKILNQKIADFDTAKLAPKINISDLRIVPNNDKVFTENYFKNVSAIVGKNFSGAFFDFAKNDPEELKRLVKAYEKTISELYSLNVPSNLSDLHIERIRLFGLQKNLFQNIVEVQNDNVAALVSIRLLAKTHKDFADFSMKIRNFAVENKLNI